MRIGLKSLPCQETKPKDNLIHDKKSHWNNFKSNIVWTRWLSIQKSAAAFVNSEVSQSQGMPSIFHFGSQLHLENKTNFFHDQMSIVWVVKGSLMICLVGSGAWLSFEARPEQPRPRPVPPPPNDPPPAHAETPPPLPPGLPGPAAATTSSSTASMLQLQEEEALRQPRDPVMKLVLARGVV